MITIRYSLNADRALARMSVRQAVKVEAKIEQYAIAPESLAANVKRLRGTTAMRLRVDQYRIIFDEDGMVLDILDVDRADRFMDEEQDMSRTQHFTADEGTEMVAISRERYDALVEAEEDADDLAATYAGRRSIAIEGSIPATVSRRIREGMNPVAAWRRHADLTQAQLAERIGVTQAAIARIEALPAGAGRDHTLEAIARALGAPLASIAPVDPSPKGRLKKAVGDSTDPQTGRLLPRA